MLVDVNKLKENRLNPRRSFDGEHLKRLAKSLNREGQINAIEISPDFTVITGHRRLRAAKMLGWGQIDAKFNDKNYSEYELLRHMMHENLHQSGNGGEAMDPISMAEGYKRLLDLLGQGEGEETITHLSEEVGMSKDSIKEYLRILKEPDYVIRDIREGRARTYYRNVEGLTPEAEDKIKRKIAAGEFQTREQVRNLVQISKKLPDLAKMEIERKNTRTNLKTNRILIAISRLGLALEDLPYSKVKVQEHPIILAQLEWIDHMIERYLDDD